jgi:site-specific recombinase XerD
MFDELFGPIARVRHHRAPLSDERREFLGHLKGLGYSRTSLKAVACELIIIAGRLDVSGTAPIDHSVVEAAARQWAASQVRRGQSTSLAISERNFRYWAEQWLRFMGRLTLAPPIAAPAFQPLLDGFVGDMAKEQGLTSASIASHRWKTKSFLTWYWAEGRRFADVSGSDVDRFLMLKGERTWARRSVRTAVQALRAFFRYAERAGHCRPGIAGLIVGPRVYDFETLPAGPPWAEIAAIIVALDTDRPADIRRRAALLLFTTYGFRAGEVGALRLDDLDWAADVIRVRRLKRKDVQIYPLSNEVGTALLRYVTDVRPRGPWREVFLTLHAPYRPLSGGGLYHLASQVLRRRGLTLRHYGPHGLRHACATRLLSQGFTLKTIGDHLGHRSADATVTYAKVAFPHLREVARFDLGGLR